jgi:hypothetical protein
MAIVIRFIAETGAYIAGVQRAIDKTEVFSKKSVQQFRDVTNVVGKWAAATAAAMGAAGIAVSKQSAESAKQIKMLSQVAGESVENFQRYAYAAKSVGFEQDKLADAFKDTLDKIGDFNQAGAGPLVDFFEQIAPKIGVTRKQFEGLSGKNALQLYVSSLEQANLSQADMTFYMEAIASDATALLPLLRDNGRELNRLALEADNLGIVLSDVDIERLAQMGTSFDKISAKIEVAKQQIALGLMPLITAVADRILDGSNEMGGFEQITVKVLNAAVAAMGPFLDAWHTLKIALAAVAKGTHFMYTGFKSFFVWLIDVSAYWIDQFTNGLNLIIKNINTFNPFEKIPLIDTVSDSAFMKAVRRSQAETEQIFGMISEDFQNLLMSDLPSKQLKAFVADVVEQSNVIRSSLVIPDAGGGKTDGGNGGGDDNAFEQNRRKERLSLIRESLKEEEDLLRHDYQIKRDDLLTALEQGVIDESDYRMLSIAAEQKYMEDLYNIRKSGYDGMNELIREHYGFAASETVGAFRSMIETASTGSKKMFKVNQALALSDALISTYQGIAAGVKLGWPQAIPAVAWAAANGFAQVSKIRSMSYGGGGGGSGGGAASASSAAPSAEPPPNTFNVAVNGLNPNQMFSGGQFGDIIGLINDRLRAGDRLVGITA